MPRARKKCDYCGRQNHFARVCYRRKTSDREKSYGGVNQIARREESVWDSDEESYGESADHQLHIIHKVGARTRRMLGVSGAVKENEGKEVQFQVDSGADVNVIPVRYIGSAEINADRRPQLRTYNH